MVAAMKEPSQAQTAPSERSLSSSEQGWIGCANASNNRNLFVEDPVDPFQDFTSFSTASSKISANRMLATPCISN